MTTFSRQWFWAVFFNCFLMAFTAHGEPEVIRFSTLAPEGTSWVKQLRDMADQIRQASDGQLLLKIYASSSMGEELDVIRKMKTDIVHAGAFSGLGLGSVVPAIRIYETPFLFSSVGEEEYVYAKALPTFKKLFAEKGMVLLSNDQVGPVRLFSADPVRNLADLQKTKTWAWAEDPVTSHFYAEAKVSPVSLPITEVLTGLTTGMVNSVAVMPVGLIGFQWWPKVKYMTDPPIIGVTAGIMISKKRFDALSPKHQGILTKIVAETGPKFRNQARREDADAVSTLLKNNIQMIKWKDSDLEELRQVSERYKKTMTGNLFSETLLKEISGYIAEYRSKAKK